MRAADGFEEFVTIVESGSLSAAAEVLDLPRATLSRRLAKLEEHLGVRLLHRTTRRMVLTPAGELLHRRARVLVVAAREAADAVRRLDEVPRGLLRVSVPSVMPAGFLATWIAGFIETYPEVRVELVASAAHVDLAAEGFDVALRRGEVEDPSLIARPLRLDSSIAVASPAYLARAGTPASLDELEGHRCIVGYRAGRQPQRRWPLLDGGWVRVESVLATNEMELRLQAALRHLGIAWVSNYSASTALAAGELVQVLPEQLGIRERVNLLYIEREFLDPKVRAFVDFMVAQLAAMRASASV